MLQTLLAALCIIGASLIGVIIVYKLWREKLDLHLSYLVSFSAGVFLVTGSLLIYEANHAGLSLLYAGALALLGYFLAALLHHVWPETHHHHEDEHCHGHRRPDTARKLLIGDGVHNVADGIMLVTTFLISPALGVAAAISIAVHEVLQTISEFFVLRHAGFSARKAFVWCGVVATTIFIGIFIGYFAATFSGLELLLLALSGGFFLHVVVHDLFPKHRHHVSSAHFMKHLLLVVVGVALMLSVQLFISDGHTHGHEYEFEHHHSEYDHEHGHEYDEHHIHTHD